MTDYQKQANDFLTKTGVSFEARFIKNDFYFDGDKEKRDIYEITLARGERKIVFNFGQSLNDSRFYAQYGRSKTDLDRKFLSTDKTILLRELRYILKFDFGTVISDKIHYPKAPTAYDVLAGLTKYDVGTLEDFCNEYGYDPDSKTADKIYHAVRKEFANVQRLWTDEEIRELQEIN